MNNKKTIKKMAILAMLLAMGIALKQFYIPVGENLRIYFHFVVNMLVASMFPLGSVVIYAIAEDLIAFFLFPSGPFFPGYTLTAVVSCTIYWIFLHKEINLKNIIFAKASANVFANILLNSLWTSMLYSKGYIYYISKSVVKNLMMLPIEIIIFYLIYKLVKPIIEKFKNGD